MTDGPVSTMRPRLNDRPGDRAREPVSTNARAATVTATGAGLTVKIHTRRFHVWFMSTMPANSPSSSRPQRPRDETSEARIAKALAHPLRARILQRLGERVASPGELAVELDAPLGVVSYHVRMLRDYDCIELVRTEPVRGALQHFYRATARPNLDESQWRTLPAGLRKELAGATIGELVGDLAAAAEVGALE